MTLTAEQLATRATGVGASESPALLGLDPYRSPIDIWERKMGVAVDTQSHHTERGQFLEPGLRAWASKRIGIHFSQSISLSHPQHVRVLATPDGISESGKTVLELKSPGPHTQDQWGPDGSDEAPDNCVVQLMQQMLVTGAPEGYLAALIDGDLRVYRFERSAELEQELIRAIEHFWGAYVETKTPPPVDGSVSASEYLGRKFPRSNGNIITASRDIETLALELRAVRNEIERLEDQKRLVEQRIQSEIGGADGVAGEFGKLTWKNKHGGVSWKKIAEHLGATKEHEEQFRNAGYREFRCYFKKEEAR